MKSNGLPDDRRVRAKHAAPESIAQDDRRRSLRCVVGRLQHASERGIDAEQREVGA